MCPHRAWGGHRDWGLRSGLPPKLWAGLGRGVRCGPTLFLKRAQVLEVELLSTRQFVLSPWSVHLNPPSIASGWRCRERYSVVFLFLSLLFFMYFSVNLYGCKLIRLRPFCTFHDFGLSVSYTASTLFSSYNEIFSFSAILSWSSNSHY